MNRTLALKALHRKALYNITIPDDVNAISNEPLAFSIMKTTIPLPINVCLEETFTEIITLLNSRNRELIPDTDLIGKGRFYVRLMRNPCISNEY